MPDSPKFVTALELCNFIRASPTYSVLLSSWNLLVRQLDLSSETIIQLEAQVCRNEHGAYANLLFRIVDSFILEKGRSATLLRFISALEVSGLKSISEEVYTKYIGPLQHFSNGSPQDLQIIIQERKDTLLFAETKRPRLDCPTIPFRYGVKDPSPYFTGRGKELDSLHEILSSSPNHPPGSQLISVTGLGGVGKTELVRKYVELYGVHTFECVICLNADGEQSLTEGFRTLAKDKLLISTTNANGGEKSIETVVEDCYNKLLYAKTLIVFDNAERRGPYWKLFLPKSPASKVLKVLMTSRNRDWGPPSTTIDLKVFTMEEGTCFVKVGLDIEGDGQNEEIGLLLERLQFFPLALQQAVSYIKMEQRMGSYSIQNYVDEFESNTANLLDSDVSEDVRNDYTLTTLKTWKITIDKIARDERVGPLAIKILSLMAYFSPVEIPRETFFQLHGAHHSERDVMRAVDLLISYSMALGENQQSILSIHRLVQEVIRLELRQNGKFVEMLREALYLAEEKCLSSAHVHHSMTIWGNVVSPPSVEQSLVLQYSHLPGKIMEVLTSNIRYNEAVTFATATLPVLQGSIPKGNDEVLLEFSRSLAWVYFLFGKFEESLSLYRELSKEALQELGDTHPLSLKVEHELGFTLYRSGSFSEAHEIMQWVHRKRKEALGELHLDTIRSLVILAATMGEVSKYDLALSSYQQALSLYRSLQLEDDDSRILAVMHNIAILQADMGQIDEGIEMLEQVIRKNTRTCSDPSIGNAKILESYNLGLFLNQRGRHEEALQILSTAYDKWRSDFGEDHQRILAIRINIGNARRSLGYLDEALAIHEEVYEKLLATRGPKNPYTLVAKRSIGVDMSYLGDHSKATAILSEGVDQLRSISEDESCVDLLESRYTFAGVLERASEFERALSEYKETKERFKSISENHFRVLDCEAGIKRIEEQLKTPD